MSKEALRLAQAIDFESIAGKSELANHAICAAAELRRLAALNAELVEALGRLHASHKDYTECQQKKWANGYPSLTWSLEIEQQAEAALSKAKEQA